LILNLSIVDIQRPHRRASARILSEAFRSAETEAPVSDVRVDMLSRLLAFFVEARTDVALALASDSVDIVRLMGIGVSRVYVSVW
jgi:hypothetical protein